MPIKTIRAIGGDPMRKPDKFPLVRSCAIPLYAAGLRASD